MSEKIWSDDAWDDYLYWQTQDKKTIKRINDDTGHGCLYNSMALEMLKDENGIPHSISPITGQTFFKDEKGEYTGVCLSRFFMRAVSFSIVFRFIANPH